MRLKAVVVCWEAVDVAGPRLDTACLYRMTPVTAPALSVEIIKRKSGNLPSP